MASETGRRTRGAGGGVTAARALHAATAGPESGSSLPDDYAYAESLAYLSSQPEQALKGVGPKRAQQLAKLGALNSPSYR